MIYPKWLKKGDLIGISAPSAGVKEEKLEKFDLSLMHVKNAGYRIRETDSVRSGLPASAAPKVRGKEFMELIEDDEVDMIFCAAGGDFLYDMLPFLDYEVIQKHPKWIQGYSDPTSILFSVTTKLDIATIYGGNAGTFGMTKLHSSLEENLKLWKGELTEQKSFDRYESSWNDEVDGYCLDAPVEWKTPNGAVNVTGRMIGGCMDCLRDLIGTPYEDAAGFAKRYAKDGLIWYFDVFSMPSEAVYLTLMHMRYAGWFEGVKAVMFGRVVFPSTYADMTYEEAALKALGNEIPLIMEADVGHVAPRMTFVNGCMAHIESADGKGRVSYEWRE